MFHIPLGALVVPNSLPDLQRLLAQSDLKPVAAHETPVLAARAKGAATTIVVGGSKEVADAVTRWPGPVVAVGGEFDGATMTIPSEAPIGVLSATAAPAGANVVAVGDVHNCTRTLSTLLGKLGVTPGKPNVDDPLIVFVGDVLDKGGAASDHPLAALRIVHTMCQYGQAVLVRGNHEQMFMRRYRGLSQPSPTSKKLLAAANTAADADELVRWLHTTPLVFKAPPVGSVPCTIGHATAAAAALTQGAKARHAAEQACLFGRNVSPPIAGIVVHGHVEVDKVTIRPTRTGLDVNVDTSAYSGNSLSALVLATCADTAPTVVSVATDLGDLG